MLEQAKQQRDEILKQRKVESEMRLEQQLRKQEVRQKNCDYNTLGHRLRMYMYMYVCDYCIVTICHSNVHCIA